MEEGIDGLAGFSTALVNGVTSNNTGLWSEIAKVAPFVIALFVIAVGYFILRRVIKNGSKLKSGI